MDEHLAHWLKGEIAVAEQCPEQEGAAIIAEQEVVEKILRLPPGRGRPAEHRLIRGRLAVGPVVKNKELVPSERENGCTGISVSGRLAEDPLADSRVTHGRGPFGERERGKRAVGWPAPEGVRGAESHEHAERPAGYLRVH